MFKTLPVNVVGGAYESRSIPLSAQKTINLYPETNQTGKTVTALQNFPGCKLFSSNTELDRGSHCFNGVFYAVQGESLYKIDEAGTRTTIGTVAGTSYCTFDDDDENMVIATGTKLYQLNGSSLTEITDTDAQTGSVTMINSQFIYGSKDGTDWVVATPLDPDDVPDINTATAYGQGGIKRVYEFNDTLYIFGARRGKTWFNSGTGSPPFTRIEGGVIDKGLYSTNSVANTDQFIYFLDSDKTVSRITGYQRQGITPPAIAHRFFEIANGDEIGMTLNIEGQDIYIIAFPTGNETWAYSETFNTWFQLSYGVDGERHLINSVQNCYGKRLATDYRNGNVYELDINTFQDNSDVQIRERVTAPITGISLGLSAYNFTMEWFEVFIETGVGLETGQGVAPEIMFYTSIDGGRTFDLGGVGYISAGAAGDYKIRVRYDAVIEFQELIIKMRISDPVFVSIHGAAISVEPSSGY